jgi:hypothetical protein
MFSKIGGYYYESTFFLFAFIPFSSEPFLLLPREIGGEQDISQNK